MTASPKTAEPALADLEYAAHCAHLDGNLDRYVALRQAIAEARKAGDVVEG